jgi:hypothetical protein
MNIRSGHQIDCGMRQDCWSGSACQRLSGNFFLHLSTAFSSCGSSVGGILRLNHCRTNPGVRIMTHVRSDAVVP